MKYTWDQFDEDVVQIVNWIKKKRFFDGIYGIPRGGLVLAVKLSYLTDIPLKLDKKSITKNTLIVDDISDTGETLDEFKKNETATIFFHKQTKTKPSFCLREKKDDWIVFPWEE